MAKGCFHYAGAVRYATARGESVEHLGGYAACCSGERALEIRRSRANTPSPALVTCKSCLRVMARAGIAVPPLPPAAEQAARLRRALPGAIGVALDRAEEERLTIEVRRENPYGTYVRVHVRGINADDGETRAQFSDTLVVLLFRAGFVTEPSGRHEWAQADLARHAARLPVAIELDDAPPPRALEPA